MITDDLFDTVLVSPARKGATKLYVVSGFASPAGILNHFQAVPDQVTVSLIVGMVGESGLPKAFHLGFMRLAGEVFKNRLDIRYFSAPTPIHVKNYSWFSGNMPIAGFTGSPNYTNAGFFSYKEAVATDDPLEGRQYFNSLLPQTIACLDPKVEQVISLFDTYPRRKPKQAIPKVVNATLEVDSTADCIDIDLRDRNGTVPARSGLNWGKRPEYNRNPNQAYIRVPAVIGRSGFFPPRGRYFTVVTDDGASFDAVVAQDNNKAIETPKNNSLLGKYFRDRLSLPNGAEVKSIHLQKYGRTTVKFCKIDDDTYFMDFSKP